MVIVGPLIEAMLHDVCVQTPLPKVNTAAMSVGSGQLSMAVDVMVKPVGVWTKLLLAGNPRESGTRRRRHPDFLIGDRVGRRVVLPGGDRTVALFGAPDDALFGGGDRRSDRGGDRVVAVAVDRAGHGCVGVAVAATGDNCHALLER